MKDNVLKKFITGDALQNGGIIEIIGSGRVIIEQVHSILEYENERVRICADKLNVTIEGKALSLDSYSENVMVVDGDVRTISFDKVI